MPDSPILSIFFPNKTQTQSLNNSPLNAAESETGSTTDAETFFFKKNTVNIGPRHLT